MVVANQIKVVYYLDSDILLQLVTAGYYRYSQVSVSSQLFPLMALKKFKVI